MPISKNNKLYVTKAQIEKAGEASALEYAQDHNYDLVRDGHSYYLREHDSMIFTEDGRWFWNSKGYAGRALQLLLHYERMSLPEAVTTLIGNAKDRAEERTGSCRSHTASPSNQKTPFELPPRADSFKRLFAYLCTTRRLNYKIISLLVKSHHIYEGVFLQKKEGGQIVQHHNAVFVSYDQNGIATSAFQRGLSQESTFKCDVPGSDKRVFELPGSRGADTVAVFEASIDAISHASLAIHTGDNWQRIYRIACGGVWEEPIIQYLREHPHITNLLCAYDNDEPGDKATLALQEVLAQHGYIEKAGFQFQRLLPPEGKDWNEYLVKIVELDWRD